MADEVRRIIYQGEKRKKLLSDKRNQRVAQDVYFCKEKHRSTHKSTLQARMLRMRGIIILRRLCIRRMPLRVKTQHNNNLKGQFHEVFCFWFFS
jgi:hypothetical protein